MYKAYTPVFAVVYRVKWLVIILGLWYIKLRRFLENRKPLRIPLEVTNGEGIGMIDIFDGAFVPYGPQTDTKTGFGSVDGRTVYCYCLEGIVNFEDAKRIASLYELALKTGAAVVSVIDSKGVDLNKGEKSMSALSEIVSSMCKASGAILQIAVVKGGCMGTVSYITALSDFVLKTNGQIFLQSPNLYDSKQNETNCLTCSDAELNDKIKELLGFLPFNNLDDAPSFEPMPASGKSLAESLSDAGCQFDLGLEGGLSGWLVRIAGVSAALLSFGTDISEQGLESATKLVRFCDAFNLPLITHIDTKGYSKVGNDYRYLKLSAGLLNAFVNASNLKINIIKNATGSTSMLINAKNTGADICITLEGAKISVLDAQGSEKIIGLTLDTSAQNALSTGFVDCVCAEDELHEKLSSFIPALLSKRVLNAYKKHSSI